MRPTSRKALCVYFDVDIDEASNLVDLLVNHNHLPCLPRLVMHNFHFFGRKMNLPLLNTLLTHRRGFNAQGVSKFRFYFWEVAKILKESGDKRGLAMVSMRVPTRSYYDTLDFKNVEFIQHRISSPTNYVVKSIQVEVELPYKPVFKYTEKIEKSYYCDGPGFCKEDLGIFLNKRQPKKLHERMKETIDTVKECLTQCERGIIETEKQMENLYNSIPGYLTRNIISKYNDVKMEKETKHALLTLIDFAREKTPLERQLYADFKNATLAYKAGGRRHSTELYSRALKAEKELVKGKKFRFYVERKMDMYVEQVMWFQDMCDKYLAELTKAQKDMDLPTARMARRMLSQFETAMKNLNKVVEEDYEIYCDGGKGGLLIKYFKMDYDGYFADMAPIPEMFTKAIEIGRQKVFELLNPLYESIKSKDDKVLKEARDARLKNYMIETRRRIIETRRILMLPTFTLTHKTACQKAADEVQEYRFKVQQELSGFGGATDDQLSLTKKNKLSLEKVTGKLRAEGGTYFSDLQLIKNDVFNLSYIDHNKNKYHRSHKIDTNLPKDEWISKIKAIEKNLALGRTAKYEKWSKKFLFYTGLSPFGHITGFYWGLGKPEDYNEKTGALYNHGIFSRHNHHIGYEDLVETTLDFVKCYYTNINESSKKMAPVDKRVLGTFDTAHKEGQKYNPLNVTLSSLDYIGAVKKGKEEELRVFKATAEKQKMYLQVFDSIEEKLKGDECTSEAVIQKSKNRYKVETDYGWRLQGKNRRAKVDKYIKTAHSRAKESNRFAVLEDYVEFDKTVEHIATSFIGSSVTVECMKNTKKYREIYKEKEEIREFCEEACLENKEKCKMMNKLARSYNSTAYKKYNLFDSYIVIKLVAACALLKWHPDKEILKGLGIKSCQVKYARNQVKVLSRSLYRTCFDFD